MTARGHQDGPSRRYSRRGALRLAGGAGAAALASGHGFAAAQETPPAGPDRIVIPDLPVQLPTEEANFRWLDSGDSKALFFRAYFDAFHAKHPNITFQYDGLPWTEIEQIVTLGIRNGNAPDVFQVPQSIPPAEAVREGWVRPIDDVIPDFAAWQARFPPSSFVEGVNVFNGRTYTFPRSTSKRGVQLLIYNQAYLQAAGYDPSSSAMTWDQFRDAAQKITAAGGGQYFGLILAGKQTGRWEAYVRQLGRLAGASAGEDDIDYRTGQFVYASDQYLAAIDLLLALRDDGSVFPGSLSLNDPQARAQTPTGVAGMLLEGEFTLPIWIRENPDFQFGVGGLPIPNSGRFTPVTYANVATNHQWIFAASQYPEVAGAIFSYLGSEEGQIAFVSITGGSDPSIYPRANQEATIDERVRRAYAVFDERMRLGPDPRVRNPRTSQVFLERRALTPSFGEVVQGIYTGQLDDPRAAMQDLRDRADAELERAIEAARAGGAEVSRDDWLFPNWDPTRDYTEADYQAL